MTCRRRRGSPRVNQAAMDSLSWDLHSDQMFFSVQNLSRTCLRKFESSLLVVIAKYQLCHNIAKLCEKNKKQPVWLQYPLASIWKKMFVSLGAVESRFLKLARETKIGSRN